MIAPFSFGAVRSAATAVGQRPGRTVAVLIVLFVLFWTAYSSISRYNLDVHGDMVENYAWGIAWQLGYYKHPPLFSWIVAAWFEVFPRKQIFYHLLASASVGVTLAALWRISLRFLDANQQILLVASAFFLPCLTFLVANYNATSAMLPFWAVTFLFYIRTLERRRALDAVLTGAFAALAILAKYQSIVLPLTLATHLLLDREARPLLKSSLPWLAGLAGMVVLAPHVAWMVRMNFPTLRYAADQGNGFIDSLASSATFVPIMVLYALPAVAFLGVFRRPGDGMPLFAFGQIAALRATLAGRALLAALALPIIFTILLGLLAEGELSSLWTIPFFAVMPVAIVLLLPRPAARRAPTLGLLVMGLYCATLLVIAPFIRGETLERARSNSEVPFSAISREAQQIWRNETGRGLAVVAGTEPALANAFAFYAPDRPHIIQAMSLENTPWVTPEMIARDGAMAICEAEDTDCATRSAALLGRIDKTVPLTVAAVPGAGGSSEWTFALLLRLPE